MTKEELKTLTNNNIVHLDNEVFSSLEELMEDTLLTNEKFNLTAIIDKEEFRELMIYDSLLPIKYVDFSSKEVIDVGTGAGYPGLPLAIATKGKFTLLDSTGKKIDHINEYVTAHHISNVKGVTARAEDYARKNREKYDIVIARAVSSLNILLELCIPLLKVGGIFVAPKSNKVDEEIADSIKALKKLNCEIIEKNIDTLPLNGANRATIIIKKLAATSNKYPRDYSEIKRKPL